MVPWNPESARGLDNSFAYHDTGSSMATILTAETSRLCLPKHWPIPQNGVINRERQLANATAVGILYLPGPTWKFGSELWHLTEVSSHHIYKISGQVNYLKAPFCVFEPSRLRKLPNNNIGIGRGFTPGGPKGGLSGLHYNRLHEGIPTGFGFIRHKRALVVTNPLRNDHCHIFSWKNRPGVWRYTL